MTDPRPISQWPIEEIRQYLEEINDIEALSELVPTGAAGMGFRMPMRPWRESGMVVGFIPEVPSASDPYAILPLSGVSADRGLIDRRVKVTLDSFYVHDYPGLGTHRILCEFRGRNQAQAATEDLTFALQVTANDRSRASVASKPIFQGLTVGASGICFGGRTVNVISSSDDLLIAALESDEFKGGLGLLNSIQPALRPFSSLAVGLVRTIIKRRRNCCVMDFDLGLDFADGIAAARLAKGSYVVVQGPSTAWDWAGFQYCPDARMIMRRVDDQVMPLNHFIIGIRDAD